MTRFQEPVQLHNHSKYSLLDAVPSIEEWIAWCLENDTPGFACTDHGNAISLYYVTRFPELIEKYNKKHGTEHAADAVIGIPGVELYFKLEASDKSHHHITAWAASTEGYFNLMKLSSIAYDDTVNYFGSIKARCTFDQIKQYKKGIKFGTACIASAIGSLVWKDQKQEAEDMYLRYLDIFGEDLYVEFHPTDVTHNFNRKTGSFDPIQPTSLAPDGNQQKAYNLFLAEMVDKHGGKPIPATDAHFLYPEDKIIQDCLLKNGNSSGWYFKESYHAKRAEEVFNKLKEHLGDWLTDEKYKQWIENTYEIMRKETHLSKETKFAGLTLTVKDGKIWGIYKRRPHDWKISGTYDSKGNVNFGIDGPWSLGIVLEGKIAQK